MTLPLILPGVVGAALLVFTLSMDEFLITYFVSGQKGTLTMYIWSLLKDGIAPRVNALASVLLAGSFVLLLSAPGCYAAVAPKSRRTASRSHDCRRGRMTAEQHASPPSSCAASPSASATTIALDNIDLRSARASSSRCSARAVAARRRRSNLIGGFESHDSGTLLIDGKPVQDIPAHARPVNTVFQSYALFPHMSVAENVEFGLRMKKVPKAERRRAVAEMLRMVSLGGFGSARPSQLAAGSASASRSPAPSSTGRRCCCSTSRSARST